MAAPTSITGNVAAVQLGAGRLYVAPIGTAEPTSASATPNAAYREVGWTEDGSQFSYTLKAENIFVAELFDPVKVATISREANVSFKMAQTTKKNLALALNAGAAYTDTAQGFGPPAVGSEVRVQFAWYSDNTGTDAAMWLFRQVFQTAAVDVSRAKAPAKALLPVTFALEIPAAAQGAPPVGSTGSEIFWVCPNSAGLI